MMTKTVNGYRWNCPWKSENTDGSVFALVYWPQLKMDTCLSNRTMGQYWRYLSISFPTAEGFTLRRQARLAGLAIALLAMATPTLMAQTIKGELKEGQPENLHKVKMKKGDVYQIDMKSGVFDTYLKLKDPTGKIVAQNDDVAPQDLNSRMVFAAKAAGDYEIVATAFDKGSTGAYEITIVPMAPVGKPDVKKGKVDANSPKFMGKSHAPFKMKLEKGKTYQIDLESGDFDALLGIKSGGRIIAGDDDGGDGLNSRLFFTPPETGEYEVLAASLNDQFGDFTLTIRTFATKEVEAPPGS